MADKLELKNAKKAKEPWTAKKVITTIIIALLSLLMIGGAYYIVVLVKEGTDDTYVFGTYNGEKIKYEPGSEFFLRVNNDPNYQTAVMSGDYSTMISVWQQAYQYQVLMTAALEKAKAAKISSPKDLVNDAIIASGTYANEDGSVLFDADVYKNTDSATREAYYQYMESRFPYAVLLEDLNTVEYSDKEIEFVKAMSKDTRDLDYFVIDYNVYPDSLALAYDISEMTKRTDENGAEVEPTLPEIKEYIYSVNPEEVKPYIESAYLQAVAKSDRNFEEAAEIGNGVVSSMGVINNVGQSMFFLNGLENLCPEIYAISSETLSDDLFKSEIGSSFNYKSDDGYVFVKVVGEEENTNFEQYAELVYKNYGGSVAYSDFANGVLLSDKHQDDFYGKFITMLFGSEISTDESAN